MLSSDVELMSFQSKHLLLRFEQEVGVDSFLQKKTDVGISVLSWFGIHLLLKSTEPFPD